MHLLVSSMLVSVSMYEMILILLGQRRNSPYCMNRWLIESFDISLKMLLLLRTSLGMPKILLELASVQRIFPDRSRRVRTLPPVRMSHWIFAAVDWIRW